MVRPFINIRHDTNEKCIYDVTSFEPMTEIDRAPQQPNINYDFAIKEGFLKVIRNRSYRSTLNQADIKFAPENPTLNLKRKH